MERLENNTEQWSSRLGFLLAAIGFSVGLGNIWRFPYIVGVHGGSAFLVVYLTCAFAIGLPLLITELTIGRRGRGSPAGSIRAVAQEAGASPAWAGVGTLAVFCVFIILSYYTVLTGWTFDYFLRSAGGSFKGIRSEDSSTIFNALMNNPARLLFWHTFVNVIIVLVVRKGIRHGVERAVKILMPVLFMALVAMVFYSTVTGDIGATITFLLEPDFSRVTFQTVMVAIGQAFFSIGIGLAALMTFGAYLPENISIPRSAAVIILADTLVALLAGFAIFPLVFAFGVLPSSGPGLIFQTLPIAFGHMPAGQVFGTIFFLLMIAAALSSCIGCGEAVVSWVDERWGISREKGIVIAAGAAWFVGLASILSLGEWSEYYPLQFIPAFADKTIFDSLDFLAANILLLLGGFLVAIFFGWVVPRHLKLEETDAEESSFFKFWHYTLRFIVPPVLLISLVLGITE